MAEGDGWWATPLPPSSPTRSLLARTLGGAFGVNGGGEGGLFSAFSLSSTFARAFNPGLAGVVAVKAETNNNAIAGNQGGVASVMSDAEMGFGLGGSSAGDCTRMPPPQQRQKQQSPMRNVKSIAERRAARCGFSAPRINTARFRCSSGSPICSPAAVRSPCLTIPPGLSPTALLDSPVMLMDAQMQPSPTTGTFPLSPCNHEMLAAITLRNHMAEGNSENLDSSFVFKLPQDPVSVQCIQSSENKVSSEPSTEHLGMGNIYSQSLAQLQIQIEYENHAGPLGEILSKSCFIDSQSDMEASDDAVAKAKNTAIPGRDPGVINNETQIEKPQNRNDVSQHVQDGDQAGAFPPSIMGRQSEDGFNWRKYGQKQVKGSEYPRGYYKCTHPECQVKKKVERSYDGQITEIIYKGKHNHPKPQPARRSTIGSSFPVNEILETTENVGSPMKTECKSVWSTHHGSEEDASVDCQMDGLERMSSTSAVTDLSDPLSTAIEKHSSELDSTSNLELSSTIVCHVDDDDQVTQESMSLEGDDEDDKSDSKRRKNENYMVEANSVSRAVREPRVVVQTESEVDILDDGYRWRKYGQKVVKGNPNPRSYYKCTNSGCSVRKHVERAAHDLKSVITTYEGKHNHEVPVARNSSQSSSTGGSFPPASNAPTAKILPGSAINPEHAAIGEDLVHFKRKLDLSNEIVNPSYPGSLYGNTKFGASSCYEMKLLQQMAFQTSVPSTDHARLFHTSAIASLSSEFPISLSMTIHGASNAALAAVNGNHGRTAGSAVQSLLLGQQSNGSGGRFLKAPKQEQEDVAFSYVLPMDNLADTSPTDCGQIMDGYP